MNMFTKEMKEILIDWPVLIQKIIAIAKQDERQALGQAGQLFKRVIEAQRAQDVDHFLPFEDEKKVELRNNIRLLQKQIEVHAGGMTPEVVQEISGFIKEKLVF